MRGVEMGKRGGEEESNEQEMEGEERGANVRKGEE